jgi:hypothetical protein
VAEADRLPGGYQFGGARDHRIEQGWIRIGGVETKREVTLDGVVGEALQLFVALRVIEMFEVALL